MKESRIPVTVITDNSAGYLMQHGKVDAVIVGADRIAANGDVANKIGTYMVAVLASAHKIPFYVAAPMSTIDASIKTGKEIPIEQRNEKEVTHHRGRRCVPEGVGAENPAFDDM
jgi:methylthioribose-1-phosphate isomerase